MKLIDTYTPKRLGLLNEFNKVVGYKINIQTSVAFLYNNYEISESNIKKPLKITLITVKWKKKKEPGSELFADFAEPPKEELGADIFGSQF